MEKGPKVDGKGMAKMPEKTPGESVQVSSEGPSIMGGSFKDEGPNKTLSSK